MKKSENNIQKLNLKNITVIGEKAHYVKGGSKRIYVGNLPFSESDDEDSDSGGSN